ncbi:MAG TPA: NIPSNAP family protein, partial [Bacillota bacterium]|nr:NIPSNAP family protein [Bacillota bacterium]
MKRLMLLIVSALLCLTAMAAEKDTRCFEMRTYYAAPGKLDGLLARFRNHTTKLFEQHGMVNIGYWVPLTNADNKLVYLLAYPSRQARDQSWKEFSADPVWQKVAKESEREGRLVTKVES